MFWVDEIVDNILETYPEKEEFIVRDEKTLSGRVHIGSVKGVVIHGIIAQVLNERGKKARFLFEFNDYDPMDGMPKDLEGKGFDEHMGKPLCNIPSPDGKAKNFAEFYGEEFLGVIKEIGFDPEIPRASEAYKTGKMNDWIRFGLTKNNEIREIYRKVSGSEKPEHWSPIQVICEKCGKVGSTDVLSFDGEKVKYHCTKNKVKWAEGCDYEGEVSPFDGNAELTWKVEWPAKWNAYHVDIEGSGKDHNAAGGSHDVGEKICEEISKTSVPYNIPYEFLLIGGAKMSSSKGAGATARGVADLLPPEILRYLLLYKKYNQTVEFDPEGETIPRLFDHHDQAASFYFKNAEERDTVENDRARAFELSQVSSEKPVEHFLPRFSQLVFIVQIPRLDVYEEAATMKGSELTEEDKKEIDLRVKYAKKWLETYAPDKFRYELQESLPEIASELTDLQKQFVSALAEKLEGIEWDGETMHGAIHSVVKSDENFTPKDCFQALYKLFLGKDFGPQAGWFLSALDKEFVMGRLRGEK